MSAGRFTRAKYRTDGLDTRPIRVQPETILAEFDGTPNDEPAGPVDTPGAVSVNRSRRSYGWHARYATIVFETAPPTGYLANSPLRIPILLQATYDGIAAGQAVTYLGATGIVVSKTPELVR